ncbi:hypothetical protein [Mycolicibacterium mageritense]|uniref:hypothetical protein n=1 Tax=Mycolicibacterium mageritense TaxID=53462 RepID=UPI0011D5527A|nr:hypothetical protein [Mycolicibacterium mageritense]TXI56302.1 MAG: hypothetical protein E6Q55_29230 [Mycolicibacterium mageritense]
MGKRARLDRRSKRHIKVDDAAGLIGGLRWWASGGGKRGPEGDWARAATTAMLTRWDTSGVVLRVDGEFAAALIDSHTDVALVPDWLDRFPFNAIAYSLAEPLSLHDGLRMCHYMGMLVTGIRGVDAPGLARPDRFSAEPGEDRWREDGAQLTYYIDVPGSQGVRCLWVFKEDSDPTPRLQTVSFQLRGELADEEITLGQMIENSVSLATDFGQSTGQELPTLITLSLSLLLYTAASDPDVDWPPAKQISRPHQLKSTQIGNLGWRTGAALRNTRHPPASAIQDGPVIAPTGRRLPAHIRKAHWHRVRVAERNPAGKVVGSLHGTEGIDWHYELRWYPPTPVNADHGLNPTVRTF